MIGKTFFFRSKSQKYYCSEVLLWVVNSLIYQFGNQCDAIFQFTYIFVPAAQNVLLTEQTKASPSIETHLLQLRKMFFQKNAFLFDMDQQYQNFPIHLVGKSFLLQLVHLLQ